MLGAENFGRAGLTALFIYREEIGEGSAYVYSNSPGHAPMLAVHANQVKGNDPHAEAASGATVTSTACTQVLSPMSDLLPGFNTLTFPCPGSCLGQRPL
jgi:hypothetical protein